MSMRNNSIFQMFCGSAVFSLLIGATAEPCLFDDGPGIRHSVHRSVEVSGIAVDPEDMPSIASPALPRLSGYQTKKEKKSIGRVKAAHFAHAAGPDIHRTGWVPPLGPGIGPVPSYFRQPANKAPPRI